MVPSPPSPAKSPPKSPAKSPAKAGGPSKKKVMTSPSRRKDASPPTRKARTSPKLTVRSFAPPLTCEMYTYELQDRDGYIHPIRQFVNSDLAEDPEDLKEANVTSVEPRRVPLSNNEVMRDKRNFKRYVVVRYPPDGGLPTAATRASGLEKISRFLKDPRYSQYPPQVIETSDATNESNYCSLDMFFLDDEIESLLRQDVGVESLDGKFKENFPEFAEKCWAGRNYSEFARSLGFD